MRILLNYFYYYKCIININNLKMIYIILINTIEKHIIKVHLKLKMSSFFQYPLFLKKKYYQNTSFLKLYTKIPHF